MEKKSSFGKRTEAKEDENISHHVSCSHKAVNTTNFHLLPVRWILISQIAVMTDYYHDAKRQKILLSPPQFFFFFIDLKITSVELVERACITLDSYKFIIHVRNSNPMNDEKSWWMN